MATMDGKAMQFDLDPVKLPHNVLFDVSPFMVMHLFLMGALEGFQVRAQT
jgi:hypothetical protein